MHARELSNPKKYSCTDLKNSYKGNGKENNSCGSKIPHPRPNNFIGPATGCPDFCHRLPRILSRLVFTSDRVGVGIVIGVIKALMT